jgi:ATP-dependent DNA ligase
MRKGIMLAYPLSEKRLSTWNPPYIVQPKLNGERCRVLWLDDKPVMVSSEENIIHSMPHILEQLERLPKEFHIELDGELYNHGMPFEDIHSRVSRHTNIHPDYSKMEYHIFDLPTNQMQVERSLELLRFGDCLDKLPNLITVPTYTCESFNEIFDIFNSALRQKYEGLIIRHNANFYVRRRSTSMMKFKPKSFDTYIITGMIEEVSASGERKNRLGAFVVKDADGKEFKVAGSIPHSKKYELWNLNLVGLPLTIGYQHHSKDGVPMFAIPLRIPGLLGNE